VTCDDFAQAIADANPGSPLATRLAIFKRWYAQAGTPRLAARGRYDAEARTYTLELTQRGAPGQTDQLPFVIPVAMGLVGQNGSALPLRLAGETEAGGSDRTLVLDATSASYTFIDVDEEPVPSLLRGFSAPVVLDAGLTDAQWLTLLAHDKDPFNRWEAGQQLALSRLLAAVRGETPLTLDAPYLKAMRQLLSDPTLDAAFKELALTLPSETFVSEQLGRDVDPQRVHAARETLRLQLAQSLRDEWQQAFEAHQPTGGYSPDAQSSGQRALANLALAMLVLDATVRGDTVWPGRAYQRFKDAGNMTDRFGALAALVNAHAELATPALERFHALFRGEALVIDKWFALQAGASERDGQVFARARALLQHPDFSLRNPNRARSLLSMLCLSNPAAFHRTDAAGYVFWADRVIEIDAFNPQLASRLARALDRWRTLAEPYRSAAREAITRLAARGDLSPDTAEIVHRALQD
jgi:aminopeptidase N